ncbi:MAG: hypothetical protein L3J52_01530 [Proteobacteria bacterium]|nr:hypothetical protein [Pseudomonadota bacterium]
MKIKQNLKLKTVIVIAFISLLYSCSPVKYKKASLGFINGASGYLDVEISPGIFLINEVTQQGGYQFIIKYDQTISVFKDHWERRALELCPKGYKGESSVIFKYQAEIKEFHSDLYGFRNDPVVSGVVVCE